jgi:death-on-curing protein
MAAAYAFHIAQNQPFVDGNKRVGLACCLVFLEINGITIKDPDEKLYDVMIKFALKKQNKAGLATLLRKLSLSG